MDPTPASPPKSFPARQRRLQRAPDFTGPRLCHFREVFLRHGLPGLVLAALLLLHEAPRTLALASLERAFAQPSRYALIASGILVMLLGYGAFQARRLDAPQIGWTVYLGALSVWEEAAFRVGVPALLMAYGVGFLPAVLVANGLFGVMHWFTLRWRTLWCVTAFLGGLAFSRVLDQRGDLALVIAFHWIGTFLNTPRPPSPRVED